MNIESEYDVITAKLFMKKIMTVKFEFNLHFEFLYQRNSMIKKRL